MIEEMIEMYEDRISKLKELQRLLQDKDDYVWLMWLRS